MEFVDVAKAKENDGIRLVVAGGFPSPWSEAAKAIFHIKKIPALFVRGNARDEAIREWLPGLNFPMLVVGKEKVRTGWAEILAFAERTAPNPRLVPDGEDRLIVMGLSHEIMGEDGLVWAMRLRSVVVSLETEGKKGFPYPVAQFLAKRYGCTAADAEAAKVTALRVLKELDARLAKSGGPYFMGKTMTAADVYSAAAFGALSPLGDDRSPMLPLVRPAFEWMREDVGEALPASLVAHREHMYREHQVLALPL